MELTKQQLATAAEERARELFISCAYVCGDGEYGYLSQFSEKVAIDDLAETVLRKAYLEAHDTNTLARHISSTKEQEVQRAWQDAIALVWDGSPDKKTCGAIAEILVKKYGQDIVDEVRERIKSGK